jgi:hypothetical protein
VIGNKADLDENGTREIEFSEGEEWVNQYREECNEE